tara:strand:- start:1586 stop:1990 length:405 start_codon:yes stop_codon:yes gene_type:complete
MEKLEGQVGKIRFSTSVTGSESTSTEQIAIFEISGKTVEFRSKESVIVENEDICVVAGAIENGLFKALALNNKTKGIYSVNNSKFLKVFGSIFTIIGIVTIPVLIGIIFTYVGLKIIRQSKLVNQAHEIVLKNS